MLPITALAVLFCFFRLAMSIAGGEPSLSASAIVAPAVSGSHILRIDGYSLTKGLGNGKYIASETFAIGGHRWRLRYYPDSLNSSDSDWISVVLLLDHTDLDEVKAIFTTSLLDQNGSKVPSHSMNSTACTFTVRKGARRALGHRLIRRSDLERSVYLKDDCFALRCDITVANEIFTKAIPVTDRRKRLLSPIMGSLVHASVHVLSYVVVVLQGMVPVYDILYHCIGQVLD